MSATNPVSPVGLAALKLFDKLTNAYKVKSWYASHEDCPPVAHDLIQEEIDETILEIRNLAYERSKL